MPSEQWIEESKRVCLSEYGISEPACQRMNWRSLFDCYGDLTPKEALEEHFRASGIL